MIAQAAILAGTIVNLLLFIPIATFVMFTGVSLFEASLRCSTCAPHLLLIDSLGGVS